MVRREILTLVYIRARRALTGLAQTGSEGREAQVRPEVVVTPKNGLGVVA